MKNVKFLFGGDLGGTTQAVVLRVYDSPNCTDVPGTERFVGAYELTSSNSAFQQIDLDSDNIQFTGAFRVAIEFQTDNLPAVARDHEQPEEITFPDRNHIFVDAGIWVQSNLLGLKGDWIIRATVSTGGTSTPDAGPGAPDANPGAPDASPGAPDAGPGNSCMVHSECPLGEYCGDSNSCTFDCRTDDDCTGDQDCNDRGQCVAGDSSGDGDGGGCQVPSRGSTPVTALVIAMFGLLWWRRRR